MSRESDFCPRNYLLSLFMSRDRYKCATAARSCALAGADFVTPFELLSTSSVVTGSSKITSITSEVITPHEPTTAHGRKKGFESNRVFSKTDGQVSAGEHSIPPITGATHVPIPVKSFKKKDCEDGES